MAVVFTDGGVRQQLERALAAHLAVRPPPVPYYRIATEPCGRGPAVHVLTWGRVPIARSRSLPTIASALVSQLEAYASWTPQALVVDAVAVVAGAGAVLLPSSLRASLVALDRAFGRRGMALATDPWVVIDPDAAELVLPEATAVVDLAALGDPTDASPRPGNRRGRFRLAAWVVATGAEVVASPGRALGSAMEQVRTGSGGLPAALDGVARVLDRVPYSTIDSVSPARLPEVVRALLEQ